MSVCYNSSPSHIEGPQFSYFLYFGGKQKEWEGTGKDGKGERPFPYKSGAQRLGKSVPESDLRTFLTILLVTSGGSFNRCDAPSQNIVSVSNTKL